MPIAAIYEDRCYFDKTRKSLENTRAYLAEVTKYLKYANQQNHPQLAKLILKSFTLDYKNKISSSYKNFQQVFFEKQHTEIAKYVIANHPHLLFLSFFITSLIIKALLNGQDREFVLEHFNINCQVRDTGNILDSILCRYEYKNPNLDKKYNFLIDIILSKGGVAPKYESEYQKKLYKDVPINIKNTYFICRILDAIYENKADQKLNEIIPKLKMLAYDAEDIDQPILCNSKVIENRSFYIFNNIYKWKIDITNVDEFIEKLAINFKRVEDKFIYDKPSYDLLQDVNKLIDLKKLIFKQLITSEQEQILLNNWPIKTKLGNNFAIMQSFKDKYLLNSNSEEIDLKFQSLLSFIYYIHPLKAVNLIKLYWDDVEPGLIIKVINDNFFNFIYKEQGEILNFLPNELKIYIASLVTDNLAKSLHKEKFCNFQNNCFNYEKEEEKDEGGMGGLFGDSSDEY